MAQVAHVARLIENVTFREQLRKELGGRHNKKLVLADNVAAYCPFTTIILSARDSQELEHIRTLLEKEEIPFSVFFDTNDMAYGEGEEVLTVIGTHPVQPVDVQGILDYLPLWGSDRHLKK